VALSVVSRYSGATSSGAEAAYSGTTSFTTGSFTPSNNSLLVACVHTSRNNIGSADVVANITLSGGSLTWTKQTAVSAVANYGAGNYNEELIVFTAPVTTGASMTLTWGGWVAPNDGRWYCQVLEATGHNTSTPLGGTALTNNNASNTPSMTLSSTPASSSVVVGISSTATSNGTQTGCTAGTGFSVLNSHGGSGDFMEVGVETRGSSTSTTVAWGACVTGDTIEQSIVAAFEIQAAAGGETVTMDKWWQPPFFRPARADLVGY